MNWIDTDNQKLGFRLSTPSVASGDMTNAKTYLVSIGFAVVDIDLTDATPPLEQLLKAYSAPDWVEPNRDGLNDVAEEIAAVGTPTVIFFHGFASLATADLRAALSICSVSVDFERSLETRGRQVIHIFVS